MVEYLVIVRLFLKSGARAREANHMELVGDFLGLIRFKDFHNQCAKLIIWQTGVVNHWKVERTNPEFRMPLRKLTRAGRVLRQDVQGYLQLLSDWVLSSYAHGDPIRYPAKDEGLSNDLVVERFLKAPMQEQG